MASAEEVQSLKREVEMLKLMLEQERVRGGGRRTVGSSKLPSPTRTHHRQQQAPSYADSNSIEGEYRSEMTPQRPTAAASSHSPPRGKALQWKDASASASSHPPHQEPLTARSQFNYSQFVPTDTKRGKWWLQDREILSRNVPAPNDHTMAMKVRETWQWCGRTVVVDKIVTTPLPRDDEYEENHSECERNNNRVRDIRHEERDTQGIEKSQSTPTSPTAAAQSTFHNSKQLAQDFVQPKTASHAAAERVSGAIRTPSQQMEVHMAHAEAAASDDQPG